MHSLWQPFFCLRASIVYVTKRPSLYIRRTGTAMRSLCCDGGWIVRLRGWVPAAVLRVPWFFPIRRSRQVTQAMRRNSILTPQLNSRKWRECWTAGKQGKMRRVYSAAQWSDEAFFTHPVNRELVEAYSHQHSTSSAQQRRVRIRILFLLILLARVYIKLENISPFFIFTASLQLRGPHVLVMHVDLDWRFLIRFTTFTSCWSNFS